MIFDVFKFIIYHIIIYLNTNLLPYIIVERKTRNRLETREINKLFLLI